MRNVDVFRWLVSHKSRVDLLKKPALQSAARFENVNAREGGSAEQEKKTGINELCRSQQVPIRSNMSAWVLGNFVGEQLDVISNCLGYNCSNTVIS